jgi:hypothetical protein
MVHSPSGVDVQIVTAFSMLQSLSSLCSSLHLNNEEALLFQEILPRYCKYSGKIECAKLLGAGTEIIVESSLRNILIPYQSDVPSRIKKYGRPKFNNEIFHAEIYERPSRINNTVVSYFLSNTEFYGIVSFFCQVSDVLLAVVKPLIPTGNRVTPETSNIIDKMAMNV